MLEFKGRRARFNPAHLAATNARLHAVAVPSINSFYSLVNALAPGTNSNVSATIAGSPVGVFDSLIGPAINIPTSAECRFSSNGNSQLGPANAAGDSITMAGIFTNFTSVGFQCLLTPSTGGNSPGLAIDNSGFFSVLNCASGNASSGIAPTANVPYFAAASLGPGGVLNFILMRLDTGLIKTSTVSASILAYSDGYYYVGTNPNLNGFGGSVSAAMYAANFLTIPQLIKWAQGEFTGNNSFWWEQRQLNRAMLWSQPAAGGGFAVTSDSGSPFEFIGNLRSDALVLLEYLASVRADSVVQLEAIAAVRRDNAGLLEFIAGLSGNVTSQLEFLGSMRGDYLGPLETTAALRSDVVVLMETLAGQRSDMIAASEIVASLRADLVGPLENLGGIAVTGDGAVQLETVAKLNFDQLTGTEIVSSVRSEAPLGAEVLAGAAGHAAAGLEFVAKSQSDTASPLEFVGISAPATATFVMWPYAPPSLSLSLP